MLYTKSTKKSNRKPSLHAGKFTSKLRFVGFHPEYANNSAIIAKYDLVDEKGQKFDYTEVFWIDEHNERTVVFVEYLRAIGYHWEDFDSYIGLVENFVIKKNVKNGKAFMTITSREPIGSPSTGDESEGKS